MEFNVSQAVSAVGGRITIFEKKRVKAEKQVICLFMIFFLMFQVGTTVRADELPVFMIGETAEEQQLTVVVSFTEGMCAAGTIKLQYDPEILEYVSAEKIDSGIEVIMVNHPEDSNNVIVNFYNTYSVVTGDTRLAKIVFQIRGNELKQSAIKAQSFKLYDLDSRLLSDSESTKAVMTLETEKIKKEIKVVDDSEDPSDQSETQVVNNTSQQETTDKKTIKQEDTTVTGDGKQKESPSEEVAGADNKNPETEDNNNAVENGTVQLDSPEVQTSEKQKDKGNDKESSTNQDGQNKNSDKSEKTDQKGSVVSTVLLVAGGICIVAALAAYVRKRRNDNQS